MKKADNAVVRWTACPECQGHGKKSKGISRKQRIQYQTDLQEYETKGDGTPPLGPKGHLYPCQGCKGTGLVSGMLRGADREKYPHIAIIGAGIGGVALAVACLHRGIPYILYERDSDIHARSQGYGLTLQQAGKAMAGLGIVSLEEAVISTRHLVHTTEGKVIGEWGARKWLRTDDVKPAKRSNMHIARQSLRLALVDQLGGDDAIRWDHRLTDLKEHEDGGMELTFYANGEMKTSRADLVVGADGIRSAVRRLLIGEDSAPLRYLDCIVILGICQLNDLKDIDSPLLDSATVFQTANGNERIYVMPYTANSVMWQLSFLMQEDKAKALSAKGAHALKEEACLRTQWHDPIPQIIAATPEALISGYPVYDRELLSDELLTNAGPVTLIGDAAHPMSPFKGQGANQALLDALLLARAIARGCRNSEWKKAGLRESVLTAFEAEMSNRSAVKVKDSAKASEFLHSETVLHESDSPRGRCLKEKDREE